VKRRRKASQSLPVGVKDIDLSGSLGPCFRVVCFEQHTKCHDREAVEGVNRFISSLANLCCLVQVGEVSSSSIGVARGYWWFSSSISPNNARRVALRRQGSSSMAGKGTEEKVEKKSGAVEDKWKKVFSSSRLRNHQKYDGPSCYSLDVCL